MGLGDYAISKQEDSHWKLESEWMGDYVKILEKDCPDYADKVLNNILLADGYKDLAQVQLLAGHSGKGLFKKKHINQAKKSLSNHDRYNFLLAKNMLIKTRGTNTTFGDIVILTMG